MSVRNSRALKRNHLCAALIAALVLPAGAALAQDAASQTEQKTENQQGTATLDKVTVTGSRIKRAEIEGPAPVTVITADDIEKQGFGTVYDALNTLSQFTGSVQNELSAGSFTQNANFLNLRGLGPGYQLVLINGRRAADYPLPYNSQSNAVNIGNIPAAAIDRIEVLTGGASAIYGSDAVAGVVNIILKTNYEGDLVTLRGGSTTRGGGDTGRFQWVGGKTGDNWSLTYATEYLSREAIYASQREFMDSYRDDPSVDPADALPIESLRFTLNGVRYYPDGVAETCGRFPDYELYRSVPTAPAPNRCGYFGYPATQSVRNSDANFATYLYGTYDFSGGMQAWASLNYTQTKAKLSSATRFIQSGGSLGIGNFYDPNLGGTVGNILRIFTPREVGTTGAEGRFKERSIDAAAGLRGTMFNDKFDWDATLSHARYNVDDEYNWPIASKVREFFFGPQLGTRPNGLPIYALNVDRLLNPLTPDQIAAFSGTFKNEASSQVTQGTFALSGDLFELPAGPLSMAAVLEASSQKYDISPDPRARTGYTGTEAPMGRSATGGGGERDRYAFGMEFSVPIFSTLKANLAGRYDKYDDISDVDGAATWSAGLEWRPFESLLLRANHSTSFRAPDMHYIFAQPSGFFLNGALDEYRCRRDGFDPNPPAGSAQPCGTGSDYTYSFAGVRQGNARLEEETGKSTTIGFVWDIIDNMSISVDYYKIKLESAVQDINSGYLFRKEADCRLGETRDGAAVDVNSAECQYFRGLVQRNGVDPDLGTDDEVVQFTSVPFNQAMQETSGIDATFRYRLDTDRLGNFDMGLTWTHVLKLEEQDFPGGEIVNTRDHKQYFNFRSRINWNIGWEKNDWAANVYGYRWGSLPNWAETGRIAPYIVWNASVAKKITDKVSVGLYVNNVFDKLAPRDDTFNSYPFFWRAYSPVGREVFVQFDYKFN